MSNPQETFDSIMPPLRATDPSAQEPDPWQTFVSVGENYEPEPGFLEKAGSYTADIAGKALQSLRGPVEPIAGPASIAAGTAISGAVEGIGQSTAGYAGVAAGIYEGIKEGSVNAGIDAAVDTIYGTQEKIFDFTRPEDIRKKIAKGSAKALGVQEPGLFEEAHEEAYQSFLDKMDKSLKFLADNEIAYQQQVRQTLGMEPMTPEEQGRAAAAIQTTATAVLMGSWLAKRSRGLARWEKQKALPPPPQKALPPPEQGMLAKESTKDLLQEEVTKASKQSIEEQVQAAQTGTNVADLPPPSVEPLDYNTWFDRIYKSEFPNARHGSKLSNKHYWKWKEAIRDINNAAVRPDSPAREVVRAMNESRQGGTNPMTRHLRDAERIAAARDKQRVFDELEAESWNRKALEETMAWDEYELINQEARIEGIMSRATRPLGDTSIGRKQRGSFSLRPVENLRDPNKRRLGSRDVPGEVLPDVNVKFNPALQWIQEASYGKKVITPLLNLAQRGVDRGAEKLWRLVSELETPGQEYSRALEGVNKTDNVFNRTNVVRGTNLQEFNTWIETTQKGARTVSGLRRGKEGRRGLTKEENERLYQDAIMRDKALTKQGQELKDLINKWGGEFAPEFGRIVSFNYRKLQKNPEARNNFVDWVQRTFSVDSEVAGQLLEDMLGSEGFTRVNSIGKEKRLLNIIRGRQQLPPYKKTGLESLYERFNRHLGTEFETVGIDKPQQGQLFPETKKRALSENEMMELDSLGLLNKNVIPVVEHYIADVARRKVFADAFGTDGRKWEQKIAEAFEELEKVGIKPSQDHIHHLNTVRRILEHNYIQATHRQKALIGGFTGIGNPVFLAFSGLRSLAEGPLLISNPAMATYAIQAALPAALVDNMKRFGRIVYKDPTSGKLLAKSERMKFAESLFRALDSIKAEVLSALHTGELYSRLSQATFLANGQHVLTTFFQSVAANAFRLMVEDYAKGGWRSKKLKGQVESTLRYYGIDPESLKTWRDNGMPDEGPVFESIKNGALAAIHDHTISPVPTRLGQWNANPYLAPVRALATSVTYLGNTLFKKYLFDFKRQWAHNGAAGVLTQAPFTAASVGSLVFISMWVEDLIQQAFRGPDAKTTMDTYKYANDEEKREYLFRMLDRTGLTGRGGMVSYGAFTDARYGGGLLESVAGPMPSTASDIATQSMQALQGQSTRPLYRTVSRINPFPPAQASALVTGKTTKRVVDERVRFLEKLIGKGGASRRGSRTGRSSRSSGRSSR